MSHELKTPLDTISETSVLLRHADGNAPERAHWLDAIDAASGRLFAMVDSVLDLSRLEIGPKAAAKDIELIFDIRADIPTALVGDPLRLGQILFHLADNAVKFTAPGGEVVVGAEAYTCHSDAAVELHFSVRDTGIGIAEEQQPRLFRAFAPAEQPVAGGPSGIGLGLVIAQKLTALMRGMIWVESAPGQGSRFDFTAHFGRQAADVRELAQAMARALLPCRLLIIDDNASARASLCHMLDAMGFAVEQLASGDAAREGLAVPAAPSFDLILLDWRMPGMDGLATIRAIRALPGIAPPPILILGTPEDLDAAREATRETDPQAIEIAGSLTKPVTLAPLLDLLRQVLGSRRGDWEDRPHDVLETAAS